MIIARCYSVCFTPLTVSPRREPLRVTRLFSYDARDTLIAIMNNAIIAKRIAKSDRADRSR